VVDNSSAWRMDPEVPLVVPEVNVADLKSTPKGIVANPNCTTMVAMPVLKPLHDVAGLTGLVVATYQAVSGAAGTAWPSWPARWRPPGPPPRPDLRRRRRHLPPVSSFPAPVAFNVVPWPARWPMTDRGDQRGAKVRDESRKILGLPELPVTCTCVRVPVFTGTRRPSWPPSSGI